MRGCEKCIEFRWLDAERVADMCLLNAGRRRELDDAEDDDRPVARLCSLE
jgi:hypothetical protein